MTDADRNAYLTANWRAVQWAGRRVARSCPWVDPDDAIQELALTAVRRFASFDPGVCAFTTWLRQVARSVASHLRDVEARRLAGVPLAEDLDPDPRSREPLALLVAAEERDQLAAAMAALPAEERAALVRKAGKPGRRPAREKWVRVRAVKNLRRLVSGGAA